MTKPRGVFVGLATLDIVHYVARAPGRNDKATSHRVAMASGGPAANAAVAFAASGGVATLVTGIGSGWAADLVRSDLERHGVDVVELADEGFDTPISSITVSTSTAERSIVGTDSSGNPPLGAMGVDVSRLADGVDAVLLDGHHPQVARAFSSCAAQRGIPRILDIGRWKPVFEDLLSSGVHAVCSAGAQPPATTGSADAATYLTGKGAVAVITEGGDPVRYWLPRSPTSYSPQPLSTQPPSQSPPSHARTSPPSRPQPPSGVVRVPPVEAVDTLGAGDTFHGGYAYRIAEGGDVVSAIEHGIALAGARVIQEGPRTWLEAREYSAGGPNEQVE